MDMGVSPVLPYSHLLDVFTSMVASLPPMRVSRLSDAYGRVSPVYLHTPVYASLPSMRILPLCIILSLFIQ